MFRRLNVVNLSSIPEPALARHQIGGAAVLLIVVFEHHEFESPRQVRDKLLRNAVPALAAAKSCRRVLGTAILTLTNRRYSTLTEHRNSPHGTCGTQGATECDDSRSKGEQP
jgi:hypothetical protein